ncbi:unnamed protein product [Caenorhabditis angaria]|uniref:Uncharacterized protein n=1 Tax=Caenorhabditis angaria TaxID=860376 RepID=A0A9P1I7L2_9PELO|nr:unnamed protein product [Caenorhabditis angaria]
MEEKLEDCWKQHGGSMSTWTQKFNGNQTYALLKPQAIDAIKTSRNYNEHKTERSDADDHAKFDASLKGFCSELIAAVPEDHPIVKFHMLDKHVPDFVKMFDSWAFVSEQGGKESMHMLMPYSDIMLRRKIQNLFLEESSPEFC